MVTDGELNHDAFGWGSILNFTEVLEGLAEE
jgi:hypothetical protein